MSERTEPTEQPPDKLLFRSLVIGVAVFFVVLGAFALFAWVQGASNPLQVEYDGF